MADDAHFLHATRGLDALIRPLVRDASRLVWGPGDALLALDGDGVLHRVHPAMGTTALGEVGPLFGLAADRGRSAEITAAGRIAWRDRDGAVVGRATHPFVEPVDVSVDGARTVVAGGIDGGERQAVVWKDTARSVRVRLPEGATARPVEGDVALLWASDAGLETLRLKVPGRFRGRTAAPVRLMAIGGAVLGVGDGGVVVFAADGSPHLIEEAAVTAVTATPDGRTVVIGTAGGDVLLVGVDGGAPVRVQAHDGPVHAVAVDRRARMVATASDTLVLWGVA